jgi:hypothetical protein
MRMARQTSHSKAHNVPTNAVNCGETTVLDFINIIAARPFGCAAFGKEKH